MSGNDVLALYPCKISQIFERTNPAQTHQSGNFSKFAVCKIRIIQVSSSINRLISVSVLIDFPPLFMLFLYPRYSIHSFDNDIKMLTIWKIGRASCREEG